VRELALAVPRREPEREPPLVQHGRLRHEGEGARHARAPAYRAPRRVTAAA
jgi:hypothetical protein